MSDKVAALFVDPKGIYPKLLGADACWDEKRDARFYPGPDPVVAHPPCQLWTNMSNVNFKRYGGEHNRPGNDGGCFAAAVRALQMWGGILEHPAGSHAWPAHGLEKPYGEGWCYFPLPGIESGRGGYHVCEVWQSAYGHKARKRTWLVYVGKRTPFELSWARDPGTHQIGWFDRSKPTLGKREASATPPAFAEELIKLARWSRG